MAARLQARRHARFRARHKLNRYITSGGRNPKIGIITVGKSHLDARAGLRRARHRRGRRIDLGIRPQGRVVRSPARAEGIAAGLDLIMWSRRSARCSKCRCARSFTAPPISRSASARRTSAATGCFGQGARFNDVAICIGERILERGHNEAIAAQVARSSRRSTSRGDHRHRGAHALFLPGCLHNCRLWALGCAPMPASPSLHGAVDGPFHLGLHPDGRRGRQLIGEASFSKRSHVSEPRRRHLQPLRLRRSALRSRRASTSPTRSLQRRCR